MHKTIQNLTDIQKQIQLKIIELNYSDYNPKIIAVSKTFKIDHIIPIIDHGHIHFGENKIQEAESKWIGVKQQFSNLQLHMVGKLQTNKVKKAVKIFDYIHSLENAKLALKIFQHEKELNKKIKLFIQVNLADENQKSGILLNDLNNFYYYCTKELSLNVIGLMCLPPVESSSQEYFKILKNVAEKLDLKDLSMGMSSDFEEAIMHGSTYLRLGTIILGERFN